MFKFNTFPSHGASEKEGIKSPCNERDGTLLGVYAPVYLSSKELVLFPQQEACGSPLPSLVLPGLRPDLTGLL